MTFAGDWSKAFGILTTASSFLFAQEGSGSNGTTRRRLISTKRKLLRKPKSCCPQKSASQLWRSDVGLRVLQVQGEDEKFCIQSLWLTTRGEFPTMCTDSSKCSGRKRTWRWMCFPWKWSHEFVSLSVVAIFQFSTLDSFRLWVRACVWHWNGHVYATCRCNFRTKLLAEGPALGEGGVPSCCDKHVRCSVFSLGNVQGIDFLPIWSWFLPFFSIDHTTCILQSCGTSRNSTKRIKIFVGITSHWNTRLAIKACMNISSLARRQLKVVFMKLAITQFRINQLQAKCDTGEKSFVRTIRAWLVFCLGQVGSRVWLVCLSEPYWRATSKARSLVHKDQWGEFVFKFRTGESRKTSSQQKAHRQITASTLEDFCEALLSSSFRRWSDLSLCVCRRVVWSPNKVAAIVLGSSATKFSTEWCIFSPFRFTGKFATRKTKIFKSTTSNKRWCTIYYKSKSNVGCWEVALSGIQVCRYSANTRQRSVRVLQAGCRKLQMPCSEHYTDRRK